MLKYSDDINIFAGDTCVEVVKEMQKAAYKEDITLSAYMAQVKDRVEILKNVEIRTDENCSLFLADLEKVGVLHFIRNLS